MTDIYRLKSLKLQISYIYYDINIQQTFYTV